MLIEIIKNKIEGKRSADSFFWKTAVSIKDLFWGISNFSRKNIETGKVFLIRKKLFNNAVFEHDVILPPLLPRSRFSNVFANFKGSTVGLVRMPGNIGDRLIDESAKQLFREFGVTFRLINSTSKFDIFDEKKCHDVDEFAISGGGNMGDFYKEPYSIRKMIFNYGKPITVLPQTFVRSKEDLPYKNIWVRESESLNYTKDAFLAPDLALGYEYRGKLPKSKYKVGVWLRSDNESIKNMGYKSLGDPEPICKNEKEYIQLAALYEKIITDRLHFAISGLIAKRKVVLLPNNYFKNRAVFEAWLLDLGCEWGDTF